MLCWFDPAIVAPRLAWLVEVVAFGGADGDVGWQFHGQVTLHIIQESSIGQDWITFYFILFHFRYILHGSVSRIFHLSLGNLAHRPILPKVDIQPISLQSAFVTKQRAGRAHLFSWKSKAAGWPSGMIRVFSGRSDIAKVCVASQ